MNTIYLLVGIEVLLIGILIVLCMIERDLTDLKPKEKPKEKPKKTQKKTETPKPYYGEKWENIEEPGIAPYYRVSSFGRVFNTNTGKELCQTLYDHKVLCVSLDRIDGTKAVRRVQNLVAIAFIGKQDPYVYHIEHIDGDPANNRVSNLRWQETHRSVK